MRLSTITNWAYGVTVALTIASGATMLLAALAQRQERIAATERYTLDRATSTVDDDVGALSSLARQYAISGASSDLLAYRYQLRQLGPIEQRTGHISDAGAGTEELRPLHEALRWADGLQDEQQAAIAARQAGDRNGAVAILFSPEYERELDRIRANVTRFEDRVDQRTGMALQRAASASRAWEKVSQIVLGITGLVFLGVLYFILRQRILRPVVRLSDVVTRLAAQDYAAEPPEYGQVDEIGDMAHALRIFRDNGLVRQQLELERDIDRARRDSLSRMTQRLHSCDSTRDLKSVILTFVPEIAPQFAGRLYLLEHARSAMVEACSWLDPVHSRPEFSPLACWGLRRGSPHRPAGPNVDVPCGHISAENGTLPDTLCMPLATQHGIHGLLYFERRPCDHGYDVPRAYLDAMAENVGLALDNLQLRDQLRGQALADPLTGLANRREFETVLATELSRANRSGMPVSCIMLDVDHFKRFNDEQGHDTGDAVLRAIGAVLQQFVREDHLAFRYGGEEFLLLLPGLSADLAAQRAEEIRTTIDGLSLRNEGKAVGAVTVSLGVATTPDHCDPDRLMQTADACLLRAKRAGRNQVCVAHHRREAAAAG